MATNNATGSIITKDVLYQILNRLNVSGLLHIRSICSEWRAMANIILRTKFELDIPKLSFDSLRVIENGEEKMRTRILPLLCKAGQYIYMYGGINFDNLFNDLWRTNSDELRWNEIATGNRCKIGRMGGLLDYVDTNGGQFLVLHGGLSFGRTSAETFAMSLSDHLWKQVKIDGERTPSLFEHKSCVLGTSILHKMDQSNARFLNDPFEQSSFKHCHALKSFCDDNKVIALVSAKKDIQSPSMGTFEIWLLDLYINQWSLIISDDPPRVPPLSICTLSSCGIPIILSLANHESYVGYRTVADRKGQLRLYTTFDEKPIEWIRTVLKVPQTPMKSLLADTVVESDGRLLMFNNSYIGPTDCGPLLFCVVE
ncbi:hypothetical protein ACOME3_003605 [Neoechinorhynchus agilis]